MHAYLNNSTKQEAHQYGKITLFSYPEEGDFLTSTCQMCLLESARQLEDIVSYRDCLDFIF